MLIPTTGATASTRPSLYLPLLMTTLVTTFSDTESFSPPAKFRGAATISSCGGVRPTAGVSPASPRAPSIAFGTPPESTARHAEAITKNESETRITRAGLNRMFDTVDVDGSDEIDLEEYHAPLLAAGYSEDTIQRSFADMDRDGDGHISRDEFRDAIASWADGPSDCPMGYWYNSVQQTCQRLGPLGRASQRIENAGQLKRVYKRIANVFGVDKQAIRSKGVSFLLTYSIMSNLNGALSLTFAWYLTVKRVSGVARASRGPDVDALQKSAPHARSLGRAQTGVSPLVPGQKRALLASYAMIYGALQVLKPFRIAAAIAMSRRESSSLVAFLVKFYTPAHFHTRAASRSPRVPSSCSRVRPSLGRVPRRDGGTAQVLPARRHRVSVRHGTDRDGDHLPRGGVPRQPAHRRPHLGLEVSRSCELGSAPDRASNPTSLGISDWKVRTACAFPPMSMWPFVAVQNGVTVCPSPDWNLARKRPKKIIMFDG